EEFEGVMTWERYGENDPAKLKSEFEQEKKRLKEVQLKAEGMTNQKAAQALQKIEDEQMVHNIQTLLADAAHEPEAADKCQKRLLDLEVAIDEAESAVELPALLAEAARLIPQTRRGAQQLGTTSPTQSL